mgnify:CR=1 FL=1
MLIQGALQIFEGGVAHRQIIERGVRCIAFIAMLFGAILSRDIVLGQRVAAMLQLIDQGWVL